MIVDRLFAAGAAIAALALAAGAVEARVPEDRSFVVAAGDDDRQAEGSEDDRAQCRHARTLYQGMLATGTNSWKGTPRDRVLADVKSCEAAGHVVR